MLNLFDKGESYVGYSTATGTVATDATAISTALHRNRATTAEHVLSSTIATYLTCAAVLYRPRGVSAVSTATTSSYSTATPATLANTNLRHCQHYHSCGCCRQYPCVR